MRHEIIAFLVVCDLRAQKHARHRRQKSVLTQVSHIEQCNAISAMQALDQVALRDRNLPGMRYFTLYRLAQVPAVSLKKIAKSAKIATNQSIPRLQRLGSGGGFRFPGLHPGLWNFGLQPLPIVLDYIQKLT